MARLLEARPLRGEPLAALPTGSGRPGPSFLLRGELLTSGHRRHDLAPIDGRGARLLALRLSPHETLDINPADAQVLGLRDGDLVEVESRRGTVAFVEPSATGPLLAAVAVGATLVMIRVVG